MICQGALRKTVPNWMVHVDLGGSQFPINVDNFLYPAYLFRLTIAQVTVHMTTGHAHLEDRWSNLTSYLYLCINIYIYSNNTINHWGKILIRNNYNNTLHIVFEFKRFILFLKIVYSYILDVSANLKTKMKTPFDTTWTLEP